VNVLADCSNTRYVQPWQPFRRHGATGTYGVPIRDAFVPDRADPGGSGWPRFRKSCEEMAGAEIRHPRQRAAHDVAAVDLRPFNFSFSIPNKVFIGFDKPVPPRIFPLATSSVNPTSAGLPEFAAYQTSVF